MDPPHQPSFDAPALRGDVSAARPSSSPPRVDMLAPLPGIPVKSGLVALMLVSLVPALLIAAWLLFDAYRDREAAVYRETELQARALMSIVDREIARVDSTARLLAASPSIQHGDFDAFDTLLRSVPVPDVMRAFLLIDRNGRQRVNAGIPRGAPLGHTSSMTQLQRVFETGQPNMVDLIPAAIDGQPIVVYAVPVRLDGQIAYSLCAGIPLLPGLRPADRRAPRRAAGARAARRTARDCTGRSTEIG
jgi:hypothetical protein